jgi:competence protein ComEC
MVDVGPEDGRSQDCLARAGISRLDLLVLTHPHADHVGNLAAILATASVGEVLVSPATEPAAAVAAVGDELAFAGAEARTAVAGDAGQAGDVGWEVLWPAADTTLGDANDLSIVVLLTTRGGRVAALGDLQEAGQAGLLDAVAACVERCTPLAVVAMAHHGSKFQDPALAALLDPAVTLVSVGEDNSYGHPAPEAIELYEGVGTSLWRTDVDGEIRIAFKGGNAVVDGG